MADFKIDKIFQGSKERRNNTNGKDILILEDLSNRESLTLDILLRSNGCGWPHQLFSLSTPNKQTANLHMGPSFESVNSKKHSQKYTQNLNNRPFRESTASAPRFQLSIQCVFFSVARSLSVFAVSVENWHSR